MAALGRFDRTAHPCYFATAKPATSAVTANRKLVTDWNPGERMAPFSALIGTRLPLLRIPVMWAGDSGDVGRRRSEATLVVSYGSQVAHMSQEKGK
jgi:hypothetical protein